MTGRPFDPEIFVNTQVIIDGRDTCLMTSRGRATLSHILNMAASTCEGENGYPGYLVRGLTIRLETNGVRPSYDTTLEEQSLQNMRRVLMHVRQGRFAKSFAKRRRQQAV
ncbi:unnamed protein product [Symbiodinium sp. CCMP2592]|nr:unnamed protein product [Symbiodinium sp. CCMP2592]